MIAPPGLARRHRLCRAAPAECKRCSRSLVRSELATRIFAACPHRHPNFRISQCPSPHNLYLRPTVVGCSGFRASLPDHGSARSSPRFTGWRAVSRVGLRHNPTGRRWRPGDLKARVLAWRLQPEAQFCDVVLRRSATRPCIAWSRAKRELIRSVDLFKTVLRLVIAPMAAPPAGVVARGVIGARFTAQFYRIAGLRAGACGDPSRWMPVASPRRALMSFRIRPSEL